MKNKPNYEIEPIEGHHSHYRVTTNKYGQKIMVPVIDVRDGLTERLTALHIISQSKRSSYISYNEYHRSPKSRKQLSL
jgi:hypothetical protein